MKKHSLILTNNLDKIDRNENLIGIVPRDPSLNLDQNFEKINFPNLKKNEIINRYKDCKTIFDKILAELTQTLNKLHKINFSERAWNIILGTWLNEYIQIFYKIYYQLDYINKNYNFDKIYTIDFKKFDFSVEDTHSFRVANATDEWFYLLNSKLLDYFLKDKKKIYSSPSINSYKKNLYKDKKNFLNKIKYIFRIKNFLLKKISNYDTDAFISDTALPFRYEKTLQLKINKIPLDWKEININYDPTNFSLRSKISFYKNDNFTDLENFLRINIHEFLPKFSLENFAEIKRIAESNFYPRNPKFIFTSYLYAYDECFKIYAALQVEKNTKYNIGQHGQNYFTKIHHTFLPEINFSDNFITWGFSNREKLKGNFNFKTFGRNYKFNNDGNLVIFFPWLSTSIYNLHSHKIDIFEKIQKLLKIIKKIDPKIREKTILRLNRSYYENFFGIVYYDLFKDLGIKCDEGNSDVNKLIKKSKLNFFTYDSTGVLENFTLNIPTIFLNDVDYKNNINEHFFDKYNLLNKRNIMFLNENELLNHINSNWYNINDWWMKTENQEAIKEFNKNFNIKSNSQSMEKLIKDLK